MFEIFSDKTFVTGLFFIAGLFMGRVSALLVEFFSYLIKREMALHAESAVQAGPAPHAESASQAESVVQTEPVPSVATPDTIHKRVPITWFFSQIILNTKKKFWPFIAECQNQWGYLPCSYLYQRLKTKDLSIRPFILEILMGTLFALLFYQVGLKYLLIEYLLFAFALVTASAVDREHTILPDSLTLSGIGIGLLGALLNPEAGREFWPALGGMFMGGGFLWTIAFLYYNLKKEEGLGGGDIKLLAWIGAVLTWKAVPFVILLSCFLGMVSAFFMMFGSSKSYFKQSLPFGPYLSFSALVYILWGEKLAGFYLSWFFYF